MRGCRGAHGVRCAWGEVRVGAEVLGEQGFGPRRGPHPLGVPDTHVV